MLRGTQQTITSFTANTHTDTQTLIDSSHFIQMSYDSVVRSEEHSVLPPKNSHKPSVSLALDSTDLELPQCYLGISVAYIQRG